MPTPTDTAPSGKIEFLESHRPPLVDGQYRIRLRHELSGQVSDRFGPSEAGYTFAIDGPQFNLSPQEVAAVFPPAGSLGDHSNCLPHVAFSRSTLPWERTADTQEVPGWMSTNDWRVAPAPWLALLLFTEEEMSNGSVRLPPQDAPALTVEQMDDSPDASFPRLRFLGEPGARAGQVRPAPHVLEVSAAVPRDLRVAVIDVKTSLLRQLLPTATELKMLCHVRRPVADTSSEPTRDAATADVATAAVEQAFVIGRRLPRAGEVSTVHLVSLEGRYDQGRCWDLTGDSRPYLRLVSLYSWQFRCASHQHTFAGLLHHLNQVASVPAEQFATVSDQPLPLPADLRASLEAADIPLSSRAQVSRQSPDRWVIFDPDYAETYWQFLAQRSGDGVSVQMVKPTTLRRPRSANTAAEIWLAAGFTLLPHQWRDGSQSFSWYRGPLTPGRTDHPRLPEFPLACADALLSFDAETGLFAAGYAAAWELGRALCLGHPRVSQALFQWKHAHRRELRQLSSTSARPTWSLASPSNATGLPPLPDVVNDWLACLRRLEQVPFRYLVPDESMLPVESIRYGWVDELWVDCLIDGAMSVGRILESDHAQERHLRSSSQPPARGETGRPASSLLLRSAVVSGWPQLQVDAWRSTESGRVPVGCVRTARLAPDILLCLFADIISSVDIHLPPETLHFGVDEMDDAPGRWQVKPRAAQLGAVLAKGLLGVPKPRAEANPAMLAEAMLEGVPKVSFEIPAA